MEAPQSPPKRRRGFSVKSGHSNNSKGHQRESSEEKARRNLHTKADPSLAMNEPQPIHEAQEMSNLGSLRDYPHKDQFGNLITDPDLSNPTRPRFERPLDTIRSFENAIYGKYTHSRSRSYARTDASSQMGGLSRRTSYYGASNQNGRDNRSTHYAPQNHPERRPDGTVNGYQHSPQSPESFSYDQYSQYPFQNGRERAYNHRLPPSQGVSPNGNVNAESPYGDDNAERTYDPSNSGTDPYGQSTDPSSINSSYDQLHQHAPEHHLHERSPAEYTVDGFSSNGYGSSKVPRPVAMPVPIAVPKPVESSPVTQTPNNEKRKSWFKRRFSKD